MRPNPSPIKENVGHERRMNGEHAEPVEEPSSDCGGKRGATPLWGGVLRSRPANILPAVSPD